MGGYITYTTGIEIAYSIWREWAHFYGGTAAGLIYDGFDFVNECRKLEDLGIMSRREGAWYITPFAKHQCKFVYDETFKTLSIHIPMEDTP